MELVSRMVLWNSLPSVFMAGDKKDPEAPHVGGKSLLFKLFKLVTIAK